jgi:photosystem II stability/assembly factor-like uncharacterized protein
MSLRLTTALLASAFVLVPCASADVLPGVSHRTRLYDSASYKESAFVVGHPGVVLRTNDHGAHYTAIKVPTTDALFSIDINQAGQGAIVGRSGLVLVTSDGGNTWTKTNALSDVENEDDRPHLFSVDVLENGTIVAVGSFATIVRSTDLGQTWQRATVNVNLPQDSRSRGRQHEEEEEDINAGFEEEARLTSVSFGDDKVGYAVGEFGMVLRSDDGGASFKRQRSATDTLLFSVHAVSAKHVVASGSDGTIVETTNGQTWKRVTSGTTNHLFGIWASADTCIAVGADGAVVVRKGSAPFQVIPTHVHTWLSSVALHDGTHGTVTGGLGHLLLTKDAGSTFSVVVGE